MDFRAEERDGQDIWPAFTDLFTGVLGLFILVAFASLAAKNRMAVEVEKTREQRDSLLARSLHGMIRDGSITLADGRIDIEETLLFSKGSAALTDSGLQLLREIAPALQTYMEGGDDLLMVSGFTDDLKISNNSFASNWELSAMRSTHVVRALVGYEFPGEKIFSAGFGEFHPRASNDTEKNRRLNRRVEIVRVPGITRKTTALSSTSKNNG